MTSTSQAYTVFVLYICVLNQLPLFPYYLLILQLCIPLKYQCRQNVSSKQLFFFVCEQTTHLHVFQFLNKHTMFFEHLKICVKLIMCLVAGLLKHDFTCMSDCNIFERNQNLCPTFSSIYLHFKRSIFSKGRISVFLQTGVLKVQL